MTSPSQSDDGPNSPASPGRPKDLQKRQAILEAAKILFLQKGFDGTSMDAIASAAGVSKLTVYSHFDDKESLFSAAVKSKCEEQLPELFFELSPDLPLPALLTRIGRNFFLLVNSTESIELNRVMIAKGGHDPSLARRFFDAGPRRVLAEMERLLRRAAQAGLLELPDAQVAAEQFFCLLKGNLNFRLMIGCCEPPSSADADQHVQEVVDLFLRAYRPR